MNLANEPILIRTLIGAILGLLVNFGVKLSGVQVESILALTDAVIPLAMAVIGALSARGKVDGPKTATEKQAEIARLKALLNEQVEAERVPSRRPPLQSAIFFVALLALPGCAAFQSAKPVLQTADAVAQQACALFFGERNRMSVEEAAEAFCKAKEQYQPWLDAVLRADRSVERSLPRGE